MKKKTRNSPTSSFKILTINEERKILLSPKNSGVQEAHGYQIKENNNRFVLIIDLQKELIEARNYHINLHVEYTQLKNAYERQVNVSEDEWRVVEKFGLSDPVNKVISKFWEDIEFITTAFFDILELLNRKDYLEKSILTIWKSQLVQVKEKEVSPEDVVPSSDDGIAVVPGYLEYLNSQLVELKGRIKWVEYNLMKYKFAASHGPQLKSVINQVLKRYKNHNKWPKFPRSWRHQNRKLEEEVEWYRKRLKFFREDIQRIKSVHQAIFQKYLTPEDQKRFPSKTLSLVNRLKGNPTNYPGSWIETSSHSGFSTNLSGHSSSSGNTVLPWTISVAGPSRQDCPSAMNANQEAFQVESMEQCQDTKGEAEGISETVKDRIVSGITQSHSDSASAKKVEANCTQSQESTDKCSKMATSHECSSGKDKVGSPDRISSTHQCYGDGERKYEDKSSTKASANVRCMDEPSKMDVVNRSMDDRNPFLKDEASKTESNRLKANNSANPFEGDESPADADEVDCKDESATECVKAASKHFSKTPSTRQSSSESSYESAEEVLNGAAADGHSKVAAQQAVPVNMPNGAQCSSLTQLAPSIYVPCSLPLYGDSSSAMRHVNAVTSTSNVPKLVDNYELLFLHETQKPPRNVLKKLFGKKK